MLHNLGCEDNELQCEDSDGKHICIPQSYRCDGFPDCALEFDESEELCFMNWVQPKGTHNIYLTLQ